MLNAHAQVGATPVQSLDTITVAASKTEERAIDALAPVSVVTLEQIQGLQPNRLSASSTMCPACRSRSAATIPRPSINIRGLQDFGRVAVVVDGARQNYQRTGHNANGSFFLDPELIGGVDVVRGPTANIYGSGAIGGVVSFRTKDINDVVRPGRALGRRHDRLLRQQQWPRPRLGLRRRARQSRTSIFSAARSTAPRAITRTATAPRSATPAIELAAGLMKLTVRPAEGHEIKFGGVFQDYQYSIGQPNRGADHHGGAAGGDRGFLGLCVRRQELHGHPRLEILQAGRQSVRLECDVYGNRTENDQVKTYNNRITTGGGVCTLANPGNNISGCVGDRRGYLLDTIGIDVNNTTRFNVGDWRNAVTYGFDAFQDDVSNAPTAAAIPTSRRRAASARCPAASRS